MPKTSLSSEEIRRRTIQRRAIEAVIWGIPVVNFDLMYQAQFTRRSRLQPDRLLVGPCGWQNQTLTPNPDLIYFKPFFDTKEVGPMVLEIPPAGDDGSITGTIMDVLASGT